MANLSGPVWGPASKARPKQLVILCHGRGATGAQLISLAPTGGKLLPDAVFLAPNAPDLCDRADGGREWFPIGLPLDPAAMALGARRAAVLLDAFIDAMLAEYQLTDYALFGFSQGAMTVLMNGPRRAAAPRGIVALAGALLDPDALGADMKNRAPVFLGHGEQDDVVPAFRSRDAAVSLRAAGFPVETMFSPRTGHMIDPFILGASAAFLQKVLTGPMP